MAILTEGPRKAEFMISEAGGYRSRDQISVTVPANTTLEAGTVLGIVTATGVYARHAPGASNGTENAAGVLFQNVENDTGSSADYDATAVSRAAEVKKDDLIYGDGANASQITATDAALTALGVVVRS